MPGRARFYASAGTRALWEFLRYRRLRPGIHEWAVDTLRALGQDAPPLFVSLADLEPEMSRHSQYQRNATRVQSLVRGISPCAGGAFDGRSFSGRMPMA